MPRVMLWADCLFLQDSREKVHSVLRIFNIPDFLTSISFLSACMLF